MIKVIKHADVYAPQHLGLRDILICGETICAVEERIELTATGAPVEVIDLHGAAVGPGYLDGHVHVTGGGGEQGPASRVPECRVSELVSCGVTTVLGLLGTDCITRSLENLQAKTRALSQEGISAYMLTGSYRIPSPTLTGSVMRDMVLVKEVIGTKVALSDHRCSAPTAEELARLFSETRVGGMVGGKSGLTVVHMGAGATGVEPLLRAADLWVLLLTTVLMLRQAGQPHRLMPGVAMVPLAVYTVSRLLGLPTVISSGTFVVFSVLLLWYAVLMLRAYNEARVKD